MSTSKTILVLLAMVSAVLFVSVAARGQTIIYVDDDASANGNGASWSTAYKYLQDALAEAGTSGVPMEVRIAQGTYKPDQDEAGNVTPGDREATFQLISGVALYGGYAGVTHPDPDERDIGLYETILSGDLLGNDGPDLANHDENSYHVTTGSGTDETAVLDGFTITGGNADGPDFLVNDVGGGMYNNAGGPAVTKCSFRANSASYGAGGMFNWEGGPILANCTFIGNMAWRGGGMDNWYSSPTLTNCTLSGNSATHGGGIINTRDSGAIFINCTFTGNSASSSGGGMSSSLYSSPTLTNCTFNCNSAGRSGGGMWNSDHSSPTLTNCTFSENAASGDPSSHHEGGGGMFNSSHCYPMVTSCTFRGNSAESRGGGMFNKGGSPTVTDCTFIGNSANCGGGMCNYWGGGPTVANSIFSNNIANEAGGVIFHQRYSSLMVANCTFAGNVAPNGRALACDSYGHHHPSSVEMANCILWDGGDELQNNDGSTIRITYSDVQGGWPGDGNIDADPLFVDPLGGDLHLAAGSPCIDAADNTTVPPDVADLDGDGDTTERTPLDLDGNSRFVDDPDTEDTGVSDPPNYVDIVDMGAYEFVPVFLDIKPGSCPNPFNRVSHGVLPVALLGTADFDATTIDVSSVLLWRLQESGGWIGGLAPNEGPPGPHSVYEDVATPFDGEWCDCHELGGDGIMDLSMKFRTDDVVDILELNDLDPGALVELEVTGELSDGTPFFATDCVRLVPPGTPPGVVSIQSNVAGVWIDVDPLDNALDGGGFADFERSLPLGTVVTLTAQATADGRQFRAWRIDGVMRPAGQTTVQATVTDDVTAKAVYRVMLEPPDPNRQPTGSSTGDDSADNDDGPMMGDL